MISRSSIESAENEALDHIFPRVLLIGNGISGGGAEYHFLNVARHLFGGMVESAVLVGDQHLYEREGVLGLNWRGVASYPSIILKLRQLILSKRIDVVFSLALYPNIIGWAALQTLRLKPRLICCEFARPEAGLLSASGMVPRTRLLLARRAYRAADLFTANSIDGLAESIRLFGVDSARSLRVPNVIERAALEKRMGEASAFAIPAVPYLVTVARFDRMKRLDDIIAAFKVARLPADWRLLIVGGRIGEEEARVRALAQQAGERIVLTGWLDNPLPLIRSAAGYVHASSREGFSNAILEAMFCDTPVITSFHSSDARRMCGEGAALGFEVGDRDVLASHMERLASEPGLAQVLIGAARPYRSPHELRNAIASYEGAVYRALGQPVAGQSQQAHA